jgi:lipopolysaccharide transport system ATP-binding protein
MNTVIEIENLGKKYIISHQGQDSYVALRDVIAESAKKLVKKRQSFAQKEDFWALRNVFLNIEQGDRVGIIGRNGAGKTTILKLISRITVPTEGKIKIKGRVVSLLEVGTGFHPELTGRENIFLNGAILGMGKNEIKRKFDEIVGFAEVEKFLDTPVKRYSSGMYVRLAFAVAAHLDSEILLIDEVLAVGDTQFQKKCLGKMDDISKKEGRTFLFVSHNMAIIRNLCSRGVVLSKGNIIFQGDVEEAVSSYEFDNPQSGTEWNNNKDITAFKFFDITSVSLLDLEMNQKKDFYNSEKIFIKICFYVKEPHSQMKIQIYVHKYGELLFTFPFFLAERYTIKNGFYELYCEIPNHLLSSGNYFLTVDSSLYNMEAISTFDHIMSFEVFLDKMKDMPFIEKMPGYIFPSLEWHVKEKNE